MIHSTTMRLMLLTNPKVHKLELDPTIYVKYNSNYIYETTITPPTKLSDSNICQQIWSCILNHIKYPNDFKRYDGNEKHWRKYKENWGFTV